MLKGQWVKDQDGKDLIVIDPAEQPYDVIYADKAALQVTRFERDIPE